MIESSIECTINFLSYKRALQFVPFEFQIGYDWYLNKKKTNDVFRVLPHRDKTLTDKPNEIKLCADRGIHAPSYKELSLESKLKTRYALVIHATLPKNNGASSYTDKDLIYRDDGTWIFDYCGHTTSNGKKEQENGNSYLINNLIDGVPVVVLKQQSDSTYKNYGLAFVEKYNPLTNMFTLHGPVDPDDNTEEFFSIIPENQLTNKDIDTLLRADHGDERKKVQAEQIRRSRQQQFRKMLLEAYNGLCAVTKTDVPSVLQAAHIDPYRGSKSQIVNNGLLLRSDIHLLYDAHLITVDPNGCKIRINNQLVNTSYEYLADKRISLPHDPNLRPSEELLYMHVQEFNSVQRNLPTTEKDFTVVVN